MARERYLLNAGEDTIHQNEIKAETSAEKRQNWWYYHKIHLLVGFAVFLCVFSLFWQIFSKVKPDYTIAVVTSFTMPEFGIEELERCFSQFADDRNGDGKVKIAVENYVFPSGSPSSSVELDKQKASVARLMVDGFSNDSILYFSDEAGFDQVKENFYGFFQYNDGTPMPETEEDFTDAMRPWTDFAGLDEFTPGTLDDGIEYIDSSTLKILFERLRLAVRTPVGTSIEKDEKAMAYYEDSLKLLQRMESGEKLNSSEESK